MWFLIPFVLLPILEIALFVQIGGAIGVGATILWVLASAVIGIWVMRRQGAAAMADLVNDVGTLEEERGDFRKALAAYREALAFRQSQGDDGWIAESLINVGFAYLQLGEFDNAQVFLQQAQTAYELSLIHI